MFTICSNTREGCCAIGRWPAKPSDSTPRGSTLPNLPSAPTTRSSRNLVERKLRIAGDLYDFMVSKFYQARSFVLEAMVVAILVIELIKVFRGG
jgi:hypothetical protein